MFKMAIYFVLFFKNPGRKTVSLKEGIDLDELRRGEGTVFEIDAECPPPGTVHVTYALGENSVHLC